MECLDRPILVTFVEDGIWTMKKILVTGTNGFIGNAVKRHFEQLSEYTVDDLNRSGSTFNVDLADPNTDFVIAEQYDTVIHLAGKAHQLPQSEKQAEEFDRVNHQGTVNLLQAFREDLLPGTIIFGSSVAVYGLESGEEVSEAQDLLAEDPYGKSKIKAEEAVKSWCSKRGVNCIILRLPLVFDFEAPGNLGAMRAAIRKGYFFKIGGNQSRKSVVHVKDLVHFLAKVKAGSGIYNLSSDYNPEFNEIADLFGKKLNRKVMTLPSFLVRSLCFIGDHIFAGFPINSGKYRKMTLSLTFDDSKARRELGWDPEMFRSKISMFEDSID